MEFNSRLEALEACMQFNGVLLDGRPIRLRQDRGEFDELRAHQRQRTTGPSGRTSTGQQNTEEEHEEEYQEKVQGFGSHKKGFTNGPRVYIGNVDFKVTWHELKDHMSQVAPVTFCDILKNNVGNSKGCALVEFGTEEEVEAVISELNHSMLAGRPIHVRRDMSVEERKALHI